MSDFSFSVASVAPTSSVNILPDTYTIATLPAPSATYLDTYARVTDLYGEKRDLMLCSAVSNAQVGTRYFWQPVRPQYVKTIAGDTNLSLSPLVTPPTLIISGSITASRTYTLGTANAFPGAQFEVMFTGNLGLFSLSLAGLDGGGILSLLLNSTRRVVFDAATYTWKSYTS